MISAGQTKVTDIGVGRQILCKEKPNTKPTSKCAKNLAKTVKAAKKGLTSAQQKLWRKYVYTSALLQVGRFCENGPTASVFGGNPAETGNSPRLSAAQQYKSCVTNVLTGKTKFKGLFGKQFKWADYLVNGAAVIKKLPVRSGPIFGTPPPTMRNPNE